MLVHNVVNIMVLLCYDITAPFVCKGVVSFKSLWWGEGHTENQARKAQCPATILR